MEVSAGDKLTCEMVRDALDKVGEPDALRELAGHLFPMLGLDITPATLRAFNAGVGLAVVNREVKKIREQVLSGVMDGISRA